MKKIEVGMLVEIVDYPGYVSGRNFIGRIGKVLGRCSIHRGCWNIEGMERDPEDDITLSFDPQALRPIDPPSEDRFQSCDEDFKQDLARWLSDGVKA